MSKIVIAGFVVTVVLASSLLAACTADTQRSGPEPTSGQVVNLTNVRVFREPDGFRNVAFGCSGTKGIYVTSRGPQDTSPSLPSSVFVLNPDPDCVK